MEMQDYVNASFGCRDAVIDALNKYLSESEVIVTTRDCVEIQFSVLLGLLAQVIQLREMSKEQAMEIFSSALDIMEENAEETKH